MKTVTLNSEVYVLEADVKVQLAKKNTKLDPCPQVNFHKMTMVARMSVNEDKWK